MPRCENLVTSSTSCYVYTHILSCVFFQFKDRTTLSCLFQLHTVLCSVSHSGSLAPDMQDIQNLIVDILASFTQPSLQGDQTSEGQSEGHAVVMLYITLSL